MTIAHRHENINILARTAADIAAALAEALEGEEPGNEARTGQSRHATAEGQKAGVDDSTPELAFTLFRKKPGRSKSFGSVTAFTSSQRKNLKTPNSAQ